MDIVLHDSVRQITGNSLIKYTNNSPDSLDRIYMHLYPNAFQLGSVKYREYLGNSGRASRAKYFKNKLDGFTSKIDIHELSISIPKEGSSWIHKIPILSDFEIDDTILNAKLNRMIAPGETIRIDLNWTHHVGDMVERAGFYEGQYNMAQWYPKLAVYDNEGWHADVFHAEGEFYGEFGDFNVSFDIPKSFIIAASGIVSNGNPGWSDVTVDTSIEYSVWLDIYNSNLINKDESERRKVTFFAENVHDFAWVASKDFLYEGGTSLDGETKIHVLYDKERGHDWTKVVLRRSINALDWLEKKFGDYAYPQITTTDRVKNGGMEYPMLVMNGRDDESLIVHEYGHVYFYGIIANNELDEAWLDEGFTTNQTTEYMMSRYGPHGFDTDLYEDYSRFPKKYYPLGNDLHSDQWWAIKLIRSGHDENISRPSYLFNNGSAYGRNAYTKPSLMLFELKYVLGDSLYYSAMQNYYDKWRFKHVNEKRFVDTFEEHINKDLDWFFDSWLHTTRRLDYEISFFNKSLNNDGFWDIELGINSIGTRFMPMLVETTFDDGSVSRSWWDNHLWRFQDTLRYSSSKKPVLVRLDPDVQTLDLDFRNNSTKMKKKILFDWPGISYNPRDEMVYWWSPHFYYYSNESDFAPGLNILKEYGPYESTTLQANYALESKYVYWYLSGWRESVHYFPRTTFYFWGFDKPGVRELGWEVEKKWNRVYRSTPTHTFTGGFYIQPEYNYRRASPLGYDTGGKLAVSYLNWGTNIGLFSFDVSSASTVGSLSDWNFDRLTGVINFNYKKKLGIFNKKSSKGKKNIVLDIKQKIIAGKIWTDNLRAPAQERYNIEGNSPNEMLRKSYLVDQFYGNKTLFSHYHLPGDGNIRGFVGKKARGADALIAISNEFSFLKNIDLKAIESLDLEFTAFLDGGVFWDKTYHLWYPKKYLDRILGDAGLGFRLKTRILEKDLYLRFDFPFLIYDNGNSYVDRNNWLISFQRGL